MSYEMRTYHLQGRCSGSQYVRPFDEKGCRIVSRYCIWWVLARRDRVRLNPRHPQLGSFKDLGIAVGRVNGWVAGREWIETLLPLALPSLSTPRRNAHF